MSPIGLACWYAGFISSPVFRGSAHRSISFGLTTVWKRHRTRRLGDAVYSATFGPYTAVAFITVKNI